MFQDAALTPWLILAQHAAWWDEVVWGATQRQWVVWVAWLVLGFLGAFPLIVAYLVLAERKLAGRFQDRIGPNRVGPFGLLQPLADALKLITKENIVPAAADSWAHLLAPVLLVISSFLVLAVVPFGPGTLDGDGRQTGLVAVDLPAGLLYLVAASSLSSLAVFLGGWSSRNKYSLIGAMRGVAQLVSYEVPQVLSLVPVILWTGSLSLVAIVDRQVVSGIWYVFLPPGALGFVLLMISSIAEINRTPFDLPEAESEIIAGYHTEYSGMRWGLFMLAEYMGGFGVSCLATAVYLGGGGLPFTRFPMGLLEGPAVAVALANALAVGTFLAKAFGLMFVMFWIRATLPRLRVDQLMNFAWKFLVPLSILNILLSCLWYEFAIRPGGPGAVSGWLLTAVLVMLALGLTLRLNLGLRAAGISPAPTTAVSR